MKVIAKILLIAILLVIPGMAISQEVVLIRHARVSIAPQGWLNYKKAARYHQLYNTLPIDSFNVQTILLGLPRRITDTVYVSNLPRSVSTGVLLYGDSAIILSSAFLNEYKLNITHLPVLLPYKGWAFISRALWFLGLTKNNVETYRNAKVRVAQIANFIEGRLKYNQQVIIVSHGFLNRGIAKELKKRNWQIVTNKGTKNLGATVLRK